jgi:hypothetical protein
MAKAKRRLTNIRVKEVSLVDEAANLRRFIVVKRKGGPEMAGKKNADLLKPDGDATVLKLSAEVKETLKTQGTEAVEKIQEALKKVEEIEVSKEAGDEVPGELIEEFDAIAKILPQFAGDEGDEPDEDFGLAKAAEEIKKAGKKISSDRLKKISDAASILSKLLEELGEGGSAASNANSHGGGKGMATEKTEETKKRSPDVAFKLAEAEVIKTREALTEAEESANKEAITKAKEAFDKADAEFKVAKEAADKATSEAEVAKAQEEADAAAEKLRKAKGEDKEPDGPNAEVLKSIVEGQKKINEELKASREENAELKKQLAEVSKVSQPSNGADTDGDATGGEGGNDQEVDKAKDPDFWAGVI